MTDGRGEVLGFGTDDEPYRQQDTQAEIQRIVDGLAGDAAGGDAGTIRERLERAIEVAGLPAQPDKWLGDTAAEIAAGRVVVVDRRLDAHRLEEARRDEDLEDRTELASEGDLGHGRG